MPGKARYVVKFVGYSAYVFARKYGREIDYAQLDFEGGGVTIRADRGWAMVPKRTEVAPFLKALPELAQELRDLVQGAAHPPQESLSQASAVGDELLDLFQRVAHAQTLGQPLVAGDMLFIPHGQNMLCVASGTDMSRFIRQITKRFTEIEQVLDQAEQIGSRINRRPYSEYVDEIGRTGRAAVECHGVALFVGGKLVFYPDHQIAFGKQTGPKSLELYLPDPKSEEGSQPN